MIGPEQGRWLLDFLLKVGGKEESAEEGKLLPPEAAECTFIATFLALATS